MRINSNIHQDKGKRFRCVACLTLAMAASTAFCVGKRSAPVAETTNPHITIRVYNYARVPRPKLAFAEFIATRLVRRAGVETTWVDCRITLAEAKIAACAQPAIGADLYLRLIPAVMAKAIRPKAGVLGSTLAQRYLDAFCERIRSMAETGHASEEEILGAVIAHEIAHVFGCSHSLYGLMSGNWTLEELDLLHLGILQFTSAQAAHIQIEALLRTSKALADANPRTLAQR